jgi:CheY-like chemotaxis protein
MLTDSIKKIVNNIQILEDSKVEAAFKEETNINKEIIFLLIGGLASCLVFLVVLYLTATRNAKLLEKAEADLLSAKNISDTANKAKTNFLALMGHEIRTPMHNIIATSSLLSETCLTDEQQAHANTIHRSSMALLAVVNDIIDFSRIENGEMPLENIPFVLRDCLDEVFSASGLPLAQKRTVYHIDENIPELIECDPVRLRQILMSLLGEKTKSVENGEVGLSVRLLHSNNDALDIKFTIINTTAKPLGDKEGHTVMDESSDVGKYNLFGISSFRFSIAARLISLMGGTIKLRDEGDKGNTAAFNIKAFKVDGKATEKIITEGNKIGQLEKTIANALPLSILVVDDHEMNQVLLVQILAKMGYGCKTARNGSEAAGLAIETKFDIIFMDILMPIMDGIEATKRIREYYINSETPFIIGVTANALVKEEKKGIEAGMNDFLIKPYKPIDVQNLIKKWAPHILKSKQEI